MPGAARARTASAGSPPRRVGLWALPSGVAILLTTGRLNISALRASDISGFMSYRQDPELARWQSWDVSYGRELAERLVAGQEAGTLPAPGDWLQLAVRDAATPDLLGDVAVQTLAGQPNSYEIGVTFARSAQGQGLATEALIRVMDFLFVEVGAHRVIASCDARNAPVARLLRRVGMRQESSQVEADWCKGEWTTLDGYAVLDRER